MSSFRRRSLPVVEPAAEAISVAPQVVTAGIARERRCNVEKILKMEISWLRLSGTPIATVALVPIGPASE
jgi:hypothetical protein